MTWQGVIPAITTPFKPDLSMDADLLLKAGRRAGAGGCTGIVALGSLGEGRYPSTRKKSMPGSYPWGFEVKS
jgi:4-hydroxy-tetrahydrodipicolinate synthase